MMEIGWASGNTDVHAHVRSDFVYGYVVDVLPGTRCDIHCPLFAEAERADATREVVHAKHPHTPPAP
jgi:hypothetical protein